MRVAVVGAGVSGLAAAHELARSGDVRVTVYEKEDYLGGHARTVAVDAGGGGAVHLDLGFMVFNRPARERESRMRVAVVGAGVSGLAAAHELARSGGDVNVTVYEREEHLGGHARTVAVDAGDGTAVHLDLGFMVFNRVTYPNMLEWFEGLGVEMEISDMSFSVSTHLGANNSRCEWGSRNGIAGLFAQKSNALSPSFWHMIREIIKFKDDTIKYLEDHENNPDMDRNETLGQFIQSHGYSQLFQDAYLVLLLICYRVIAFDGSEEIYDRVVFGVHAPDALKLLGAEATHEELRILGSFQYVYSDIYLHSDKSMMPRSSSAWSAWNFLGTTSKGVCVTYWLNLLQNIESMRPFLVTLNPPHVPDHVLLKWYTSHPVPSVAAAKASHELHHIQGNRGIWFCGAYQGYGFHEDGLKAGKAAAQCLLGKESSLLVNPKQMVPSWTESGARILVASLFEEGGTMFSFGEAGKRCHAKSVLRVHDPLFYWKVATEADLGLADAYINGYFSFVDKREGLLNLFLSNEFFSLFLDPTMTYSCAIFKTDDESLETAQLRKVCLLIDKAKVERDHHVLEIGSGWGSLAIQVVKQTGCKYTGITLSVEQQKYAQRKVKEAGLEFISIPEERYEEYRRSSDFIKEYIFPGGCLPSLARITSAMSAASRLCIEHLENIGYHYYQTLIRWRDNFMANKE
ncbi:hypothetical protein PR202_gb02635 [Eleusine coracana subsp. coracana]|uniref:Amine oxidase domain-containing protein n=1 Tax=Eleusine coracana subsp. coracana TaxID=191504 RepID=A0AAV5DY80_ELECO|nr:hypothetical protein PR202_gb02635 [Eleusine coracana subsp. coracana]